MTAAELADEELPLLKQVDTCDQAMSFMDEYKLSHYPVVNEGLYVGLVYEKDLFEFDDWSQTIAQSHIRLPQISVNENDHFLSTVQRMFESKLTVLPVINTKGLYKGMISNSRVVQVFGSASIVQDIGSVIEIELAANDYYLTEISRIIENTNVKILGTYIRNIADNKIVLTIKLNKHEVEEALNTLDRFGYKVFASYHLKSENSTPQDRFENLMHILNL